jgi:hypothetical protein
LTDSPSDGSPIICVTPRHRKTGNKLATLEIIPIDEKIDFIFDTRSEGKFILKAWEDFLEKRPESREFYGQHPRFEDDIEFKPLQAADFWPWWVREWHEEDNSPTPDKMRVMDFGSWKGTRTAFIHFSLDEQFIFDTLRDICTLQLIRHRPNWD